MADHASPMVYSAQKNRIKRTFKYRGWVQSPPPHDTVCLSICIGSRNVFVRVSFDITTPSITCKFINQPKKIKKFYKIEYGLVTDDCMDLPFDMEGYLSNSNSVTLQLQLATSEICFVVKASSGSKTVIVEGIHKPRKCIANS